MLCTSFRMYNFKPPSTKVFCAVYDYTGKANLSKGYWIPERKLVVHVATDFSEIMANNNIILKSWTM